MSENVGVSSFSWVAKEDCYALYSVLETLCHGRKTLNTSVKCLVPHLSEEDRLFAPVFGLQVWNGVLKSQM